MIFRVLKFSYVRYIYTKQVMWEIEQPCDGIFTQ